MSRKICGRRGRLLSDFLVLRFDFIAPRAHSRHSRYPLCSSLLAIAIPRASPISFSRTEDFENDVSLPAVTSDKLASITLYFV